MTNVRIVSDSAADILVLDGVDFAAAPLKIITEETEYTDNVELDVKKMVRELSEYSGRSSTSCPNARDWLRAFGDAENVFCITLTGTLSGSYNAAMTASAIYRDSYPERKVFVLNSMSAGPEMGLMVEKLRDLVAEGNEFDEVCKAITKYAQKTELLFMLASMKNFANNGRVSPIVAKMAGLLGIRIVGRASDKGELEPLDKCRGEVKALETIVERMIELGYGGKKVRIGHCFNENAAKNLRSLIKIKYPKAHISIYRLRGLCSYYAELGGLLVAFER